MGGIIILFSGYFSQILPVLLNGTKEDELNACIKYSYIWHSINQHHLKTNMRLINNNNKNESTFANNILKIGNGDYLVDNNNCLQLDIGILQNDIDELKND